jgi:hypothetical protein
MKILYCVGKAAAICLLALYSFWFITKGPWDSVAVRLAQGLAASLYLTLFAARREGRRGESER